MSIHYSWINLTCLIGSTSDETIIKSKELNENFNCLGTGFLLFSNEKAYLVTARHVVQNEEHNRKNLICIFDFVENPDIGSHKEFIKIEKMQEQTGFKWHFHSEGEYLYGKGNSYLIDLAVLPFHASKKLSKAFFWGNNDI